MTKLLAHNAPQFLCRLIFTGKTVSLSAELFSCPGKPNHTGIVHSFPHIFHIVMPGTNFMIRGISPLARGIAGVWKPVEKRSLVEAIPVSFFRSFN